LGAVARRALGRIKDNPKVMLAHFRQVVLGIDPKERRKVSRYRPPAAPIPRMSCRRPATDRLLPVSCYRAGVEAWRRAHPDQRPEYA
jgi:hypothetical protein